MGDGTVKKSCTNADQELHLGRTCITLSLKSHTNAGHLHHTSAIITWQKSVSPILSEPVLSSFGQYDLWVRSDVESAL